MSEKRRTNEQTTRPPLSTIHSDDGHKHRDPKPVKRAETAPNHSMRPSKSLRRKDSDKTGMMSHSDTISSKRPLVRMPSIHTRYMEMLLHLDEIPRIYNILGSLFTWIILAGFLVVPGTCRLAFVPNLFVFATSNELNTLFPCSYTPTVIRT